MPRCREAVWDPHASSGPTPVFMLLLCSDLQAGEYGRQQFADGHATAMTMRLPLQDIRDDFRFAAARVVGEL